ncbi:MFS transporter [Trueperella sp. LYQ143]|uniref:MFS transporter n=1 Tax=Trueperella sp. LYQ143 TaxID=3391059 RepID=UPI003982FF22
MRATGSENVWRGHFSRFFLGRVVDLAGSSMTSVAIGLSVLQTTDSPRSMGLVLAANVFPTLVFMLVGGVIADRWERGRILVVTCLLSAVTQGAMAAILFSGRFNLGLMSACAALSGMIGAFNGPALRGIVPDLVASEQVHQANALLATARNATRIIGPALAGALVASIGGGWALTIDAISFLLAGLCFWGLPTVSRAKNPAGIGRSLIEGWSTFCSMRWVWTLSIAYAVINLLYVGPWQVLGPDVLRQRHGIGIWGVILSVRAVAQLVASVLLVRISFRNPLLVGLLLGTAVGFPLIALGVTDSLVVVIPMVIMSAVGLTVSGITYETTLQTHVSRDKLSRVAAYDDLFVFLSVPISQIAVGWVGTVFDIHTVLLASGIGLVILHILPAISREVRTISRVDK